LTQLLIEKLLSTIVMYLSSLSRATAVKDFSFSVNKPKGSNTLSWVLDRCERAKEMGYWRN